MVEQVSFDDVLLIPSYSDLSSRSEVNLSTFCGWATLKTPVISSPMDTVSSFSMLHAMRKAGGTGVHHRYCSMDELENAGKHGFPVAVSPSMGIKEVLGLSASVVCIDVANGDTKDALTMAHQLRKAGKIVISGNIVSPESARRYAGVGVDIFRVGIGGGSSCSTRTVSGVGYPQLSAIVRIHKEFPLATIISDGGIRASGDIIKALAGGANCVMLGRLLAGATEAPGKRRFNFWKWRMEKEFRGMASRQALKSAGKEINEEGISTWVSLEGPVSTIIEQLNNGIRAGMGYTGVRSIRELQEKARFVCITHAGFVEGLAKV